MAGDGLLGSSPSRRPDPPGKRIDPPRIPTQEQLSESEKKQSDALRNAGGVLGQPSSEQSQSEALTGERVGSVTGGGLISDVAQKRFPEDSRPVTKNAWLDSSGATERDISRTKNSARQGTLETGVESLKEREFREMISTSLQIVGKDLRPIGGDDKKGVNESFFLCRDGKRIAVAKPKDCELGSPGTEGFFMGKIPEGFEIRPGIKPGYSAFRERVGYLMGKRLLGERNPVPITMLHKPEIDSGSRKRSVLTSYQKFVPEAKNMTMITSNEERAEIKKGIPAENIRAMLLLDVATYNMDRGWHNIMYDSINNRFVAIDNGLTCASEYHSPFMAEEMEMLQSDTPLSEDEKRMIQDFSWEAFEKEIQEEMERNSIPGDEMAGKVMDFMKARIDFIKEGVEKGLNPYQIACFFKQKGSSLAGRALEKKEVVEDDLGELLKDFLAFASDLKEGFGSMPEKEEIMKKYWEHHKVSQKDGFRCYVFECFEKVLDGIKRFGPMDFLRLIEKGKVTREEVDLYLVGEGERKAFQEDLEGIKKEIEGKKRKCKPEENRLRGIRKKQRRAHGKIPKKERDKRRRLRMKKGTSVKKGRREQGKLKAEGECIVKGIGVSKARDEKFKKLKYGEVLGREVGGEIRNFSLTSQVEDVLDKYIKEDRIDDQERYAIMKLLLTEERGGTFIAKILEKGGGSVEEVIDKLCSVMGMFYDNLPEQKGDNDYTARMIYTYILSSDMIDLEKSAGASDIGGTMVSLLQYYLLNDKDSESKRGEVIKKYVESLVDVCNSSLKIIQEKVKFSGKKLTDEEVIKYFIYSKRSDKAAEMERKREVPVMFHFFKMVSLDEIVQSARDPWGAGDVVPEKAKVAEGIILKKVIQIN
jgi:hypothetical protein